MRNIFGLYPLMKTSVCHLRQLKTAAVLFFLFCIVCWEAAAEKRLKLGIERLPQYRTVFAGKRVGLITNQTGIDSEGGAVEPVGAAYGAFFARTRYTG